MLTFKLLLGTLGFLVFTILVYFLINTGLNTSNNRDNSEVFSLTGTQEAINTHNANATDTQEASLSSVIIEASDPHLIQALQLANTSVSNNTQWQSLYPHGFIQEFDGVPMVLVPIGCFQMGDDPDAWYLTTDGEGWITGVPDGGAQCFDSPFWIDQTEVTQFDFERLGGEKTSSNAYDGYTRPVEQINWFEARDYCEQKRGGRLPTEAEWEYATRGVDSRFFPWGNEWNENNVVWNRDISEGTADVASIPTGASWVGAFDMSGNVWEWTGSAYQDYPYDSSDGREADGEYSANVLYTPRGGSWKLNQIDFFHSATRAWFPPGNSSNDGGFRCVRMESIPD